MIVTLFYSLTLMFTLIEDTMDIMHYELNLDTRIEYIRKCEPKKKTYF